MTILDDILRQLDIPIDVDYFDIPIDKREKFISLLWDQMYQKPYLSTYREGSRINPFDMENDIVVDLYIKKEEFLNEEKYEEVQIIQDLLNMTQDKLNQIRNYANSKNR